MNDYRLKRRKYSEKAVNISLKVPESKANDLKALFYEILNYVRNQGTDKVLRSYYSLNLNRLLEIELSETELKKFAIILMELLDGLDTYGLDKLCSYLKQGAKWKLIGI